MLWMRNGSTLLHDYLRTWSLAGKMNTRPMCDCPNLTIRPILVEGLPVIDFNVTTPSSNRLVRLMIPELIGVAMNHEEPISYKELSQRIHHRTARIGYQLGCIIDIFESLNKYIDFRVPPLTGLCVSTYTGFPGKSFNRIIPHYSEKSHTEKVSTLNCINQEAYNFKRWEDVLIMLGLNQD